MKSFYYFSTIFIIAGIALTVAIFTSSTPAGIAVAALFYPPWAYLIFKNFPVRNRNKNFENNTSLTNSLKSEYSDPNDATVDTDKRAFLKVIGAAGLSYLLYSLFAKKPSMEFFGELGNNADNSYGTQNRQTIEGYHLTEIIDEANTYSGFTNKNGEWYIMMLNTETGSVRYAKGDIKFPENWAAREKLTYDYFYNVFK